MDRNTLTMQSSLFLSYLHPHPRKTSLLYWSLLVLIASCGMPSLAQRSHYPGAVDSGVGLSSLHDRTAEPGQAGRLPEAGVNAMPQVQAAASHFEAQILANPRDPVLYYNLLLVSCDQSSCAALEPRIMAGL